MTPRRWTLVKFVATTFVASAACAACGGAHSEEEVTANAPVPVAMVTDRASAKHTHAPEAMQRMLKETTPDLVLADHGFAGAAIEAGIDAVSVADVNEDGQVSCSDLAIIRASFGKRAGQAGFDPRADVNRDGIVNVYDLSFVSQRLPAGTRC